MRVQLQNTEDKMELLNTSHRGKQQKEMTDLKQTSEYQQWLTGDNGRVFSELRGKISVNLELIHRKSIFQKLELNSLLYSR